MNKKHTDQYQKLTDQMQSLSRNASLNLKMTCQNNTEKGMIGNYLYEYVNDAYKSIETICKCLNDDALAQACMLIRPLIESVATIKVLMENPDVMEMFTELYIIRRRLNGKDGFNKAVKILFEDELESSDNILNFISYGWVKSLSDDGKYDIEKIISLAGFDELKHWRNLSSSYLHLGYTSKEVEKNDLKFEVLDLVARMTKELESICTDKYAVFDVDSIRKEYNDFNQKFSIVSKIEK